MPRRPMVMFLLLLGCGHTDPLSTPPPGTDQPFDPSPPVRLTLNPAEDRAPGWLADGSALLYSARDLGRTDRDVCLALLPPTGGQQRALWCNVPDGGRQTDAVLGSAASVEGRLAFFATASSLTSTVPERLTVRVAPVLDPRGGVEVLRLPYPRATRFVNLVGQIRWLGPDRLVYLGQLAVYRGGCPPDQPFCPAPVFDTTVTSADIELLSLAQGGGDPTAVPETELASGVATIPGSDEILYTLAGDTRVYRRNVASGVVTVAHDFGAAGVARDLDAAGTRLVAVVGGVVGMVDDPTIGHTQWDSGGVVHVVDLAAGGDTPLEGPGRLFRRPAISPAGDRVVAEGYSFRVTQIADPVTQEPVVDTIVSPTSDLFLFGGP